MCYIILACENGALSNNKKSSAKNMWNMTGPTRDNFIGHQALHVKDKGIFCPKTSMKRIYKYGDKGSRGWRP